MEELANIILRAAKSQGAEHAQVTVNSIVEIGTRFGENHITQNVYDIKTEFTLKTQIGQKVSTYSGNNPRPESIEDHIKDALVLTKFSGEDPDFPGFLEEQPKYANIDVPMIELDPEKIADAIHLTVESARSVDSKVTAVAGNIRYVKGFSYTQNSYDVAGFSKGVSLTSVINIAATQNEGESRSIARLAARTIDGLDLAKQSELVAQRAVQGLNQQEMDIGSYAAVLSPLAVSALWGFVVMGASSEGLITHTSFLKDKLGEQIFDGRITVKDDSLNPAHLAARAFDSELVPTMPLAYIEEGVLKEFAYNRRNAKKLGVESNGRNAQGFQGEMPLFISNTILPGTKSEEDLIASVDDGIYITNLFYNNFVNPPQGICTGLTRDGLFRIKNGEIVYSLKNFRWTDSLTSIFKNAEPANNSVQVAGFFGGSSITPSMLVDRFNLTSKGKH